MSGARRDAEGGEQGRGARRFRRLFRTRSTPMREVLATAEKVLPTEANVLLLGESGVGKDYLAEALHACGPRGARPFVRIDCSSLPEELFEAELFGYEKGAFTDASMRKLGRIEMAQGGTLYLDEVGSLAPHLQAKLLRVLQDRQFSRLGDTRTVTIDVRVVSSSNLAPEELVDERKIRKDLLFRLNVVSLRLPPLRERKEDIGAMARVFLRDAARRLVRPARHLDPDAMQALRDHSWPGNLRELRNTMERAAIVTESERVGADSLPTERFIGGKGLLGRAAEERWSLEQLERRYVEEILRQTDGNQSRAALILGISRKTLLEKRKKWGL